MGRKNIQQAEKYARERQNQKKLSTIIKKLGVDPLEVVRLTSTLYVLADIQQSLSLKLADTFKGAKMSFKDHEYFDRLKIITNYLVRRCDEDLISGADQEGLTKEKWAIDHGEKCDFMKEAVDALMGQDLADLNFILNVIDIAAAIPKDKQVSCISTLKIYKSDKLKRSEKWNKTWCKKCGNKMIDKNQDMIDNGHNVKRQTICPNCGFEYTRVLK